MRILVFRLVFISGLIGLFSSIRRLFLFYLLIYRLVITFFLRTYYGTWLGIIFYLVYVGALLVLFFYVFSLFPKPGNVKFLNNMLYLLLLVVFRVILRLNIKFISRGLNFRNYSNTLFRRFDGSTVGFLVLFLLFVLWIIAKLGIFNISSLRPFY